MDPPLDVPLEDAVPLDVPAPVLEAGPLDPAEVLTPVPVPVPLEDEVDDDEPPTEAEVELLTPPDDVSWLPPEPQPAPPHRVPTIRASAKPSNGILITGTPH